MKGAKGRGARLRRGLVMGLLLVWCGKALAAGSAEHASIPLTRVLARQVCADGTTLAGIRVADTPARADQLWSLCQGRTVLGGGSEERPSLDLAEERLIYIHMGARRTGGYRLDLADREAAVVDDTLVIPVIWAEPSKDAMVTQMLTHPCLLLTAPRGPHPYRRIEVVDRGGRIRLSVPLPAGAP